MNKTKSQRVGCFNRQTKVDGECNVPHLLFINYVHNCVYTHVYSFLFSVKIFINIILYNMDNLINKNIGLQNNGMNEYDAWLIMLKKSQTKLFNSYKKKDNDVIDENQKIVDFIQKQLIRLTQR